MKLPSRIKSKIRKYERPILNKAYPYGERLYVLYLILSPWFVWYKKELLSRGTRKEDIEVDLYLALNDIFRRYDPDRSSLVPYLERAILWMARGMPESIHQFTNPPEDFFDPYESYTTVEEYYLTAPEILFNNKFLGKEFTREHKYIIYKIFTLDEDRISSRNLAEELNISRTKLLPRLNEIKNILQNGGYNGERTNQ